MKQLFQCFHKREWFILILTTCMLACQVALDLRLPDYMSEITTLVQTENSDIADILLAGAKMMGCAFGGLILTILVGYFSAQMATKVAQRMRNKVFSKTISFSMGDINHFSTGSLITRSTNDITQIQLFLTLGFVVLVRSPLTSIFAITKIAGKNMVFTQITLLAVCVLVAVLFTMIAVSVPKSKKIQVLTDHLNTKVREHLIGIRVVRAYNAESYQENKFSISNNAFSSTSTFVNRTTAIMLPFLMGLMSILTMLIYWAGAFLINEAVGMDKLTIFSDMVVFTSYAMQIIMSFMMLTMIFMMLPRVVVALNRINEVLDFTNSVADGSVTKGRTEGQIPVISFENVSFSYSGTGERVLDNLNFTINRGETVAIIGSTGSGKSSIVNLLLRFYDCTEGVITIDGVSIRDYQQQSLRKKFGLVSQKATLFSGDIKNNITIGSSDEISNENLSTAVSISQSKDFVDKIGFDGKVSQGGLNLSGGQKQRISIARALYKKPEIYLFDDCFSALDYKTDRTLRSQLQDMPEKSTKIMVAQRISTVKDADKIMVLDKGKIVGIGTHAQLLENCSIYLEIAESQLSKEELAQ